MKTDKHLKIAAKVIGKCHDADDIFAIAGYMLAFLQKDKRDESVINDFTELYKLWLENKPELRNRTKEVTE